MADHLGENADGGCGCGVLLFGSVPSLVRWPHANPLLLALTSYIARKPAICRVGGAVRARISGPAALGHVALRGVRCRCDNAWPAGDATPIRPARPLACLQSLSKRLHYGCPKMLHVIPLRLVQILNSCRWNCNVFGWSRKMTEGNYVRNLSGLLPAVHRHSRRREPASSDDAALDDAALDDAALDDVWD